MHIGEYTVILEAVLVYTCPLIQHIHVQESIGYTQYTIKWLLICMFKKCFNGKSFKQIYANLAFMELDQDLNAYKQDREKT